MDEKNSFERLVNSLSQKERIDLLNKLKENSDIESQTLDVASNDSKDESDLIDRYKAESFFLRLWIRIKTFFSSNDIETLYNEHLVTQLALHIERDFPDILDFKHKILCTTLYTKLAELKSVSDFFISGIGIYEENQGAFFVFLGSLVIPELSQRIDKEVSPYILPLNREITTELRASLIRKLEEILGEISQSDRNRLYTAIKGLEWLKAFCHLPFERLLKRFNSVIPGLYTCTLDSASSDFSTFARVLCNGTIIKTEVIEALYLYSRQNINTTDTTESSIAAEEEIDEDSEYIQKSTEQIKLLKMFITSVPMLSLTAIANNSSIWHAEKIIGSEDWFVKYKTHWRKLFDQKWEMWLFDKRKKEVFNTIRLMLSCKDYPYIPNRPWKDVWDGIPFTLEHSIGFMHAFFQDLYPVYSKVLKTILVEGDFTQKDNRIEFTDTYNLLNHLAQSIVVFNDKLSIKGIYGSSFTYIIKESLRTIQGQARIDSLMNSIESEARLLISQFADTCRSMQLITGGILHKTKDPRYDTLANVSSIMGNKNIQFRKNLQDVRSAMINSLDIIKELESLEVINTKGF